MIYRTLILNIEHLTMEQTVMVYQELKTIIENECEVDLSGLTKDSSLIDDLELDSVALLSVVYKVEERFNIKIPYDFEVLPETFGEMVSWIEESQQKGKVQ